MADDDSDEEYDRTKVTLAKVSDIRKDSHVVIQGRPCRVVQRCFVGLNRKICLVGVDIFTDKRLEGMFILKSKVEVPIIHYRMYNLVDISDDGFMSLLDENGETKDDVMAPTGVLGKNLRDAFKYEKEVSCTMLSSMGEEALFSFESN